MKNKVLIATLIILLTLPHDALCLRPNASAVSGDFIGRRLAAGGDMQQPVPVALLADNKIPQWPQKIWQAIESIGGIDVIKKLSYGEFMKALSRETGIYSACINRAAFEAYGFDEKIYPVKLEFAFSISPQRYKQLLDDPAAGKRRLDACGIVGPGVYIDESVPYELLFSFSYLELPIHNIIFHEFCEQLAAIEGDIDRQLISWHGHRSFSVLVETLRFSKLVGKPEAGLKVWQEVWQRHLDYRIVCKNYPEILRQKFQRLFGLAESGELFTLSRDDTTIRWLCSRTNTPSQQTPNLLAYLAIDGSA